MHRGDGWCTAKPDCNPSASCLLRLQATPPLAALCAALHLTAAAPPCPPTTRPATPAHAPCLRADSAAVQPHRGAHAHRVRGPRRQRAAPPPAAGGFRKASLTVWPAKPSHPRVSATACAHLLVRSQRTFLLLSSNRSGTRTMCSPMPPASAAAQTPDLPLPQLWVVLPDGQPLPECYQEIYGGGTEVRRAPLRAPRNDEAGCALCLGDAPVVQMHGLAAPVSGCSSPGRYSRRRCGYRERAPDHRASHCRLPGLPRAARRRRRASMSTSPWRPHSAGPRPLSCTHQLAGTQLAAPPCPIMQRARSDAAHVRQDPRAAEHDQPCMLRSRPLLHHPAVREPMLGARCRDPARRDTTRRGDLAHAASGAPARACCAPTAQSLPTPRGALRGTPPVRCDNPPPRPRRDEELTHYAWAG